MSAVKRKEGPDGSVHAVKKQKTATSPPTSKTSSAQKSGDAAKQHTKSRGNAPPARADKDSSAATKQFKLDTSSSEAHAKQRALAKERRANKPNSDAIQRSKKIWERLRIKSRVPAEERKQLVAELFSIISGQMNDFIFKHDSGRVIQCALKYANQEQRRQISKELMGSIRDLVESRYGKFLVAKLVQDGDKQVRDAVVPNFYGHVRRLINHPEASWIVDDIYRQIASSQQKVIMLREWYGAEFALSHRRQGVQGLSNTKEDATADLAKILEQDPAKRKPILQYLLQMINSLIQKKMTGFTMLHDAMLQYFTALVEGSAERAEFLEILKGDIDAESEGGGGDLFRNLSFTKSGSKLVCLALAYSSAKDRKIILRCFKDNVELMAFDQYAKMVLLVGLEVTDDTKMSSRSILFEILGQGIEDETQRLDRLEQIVTNLNARVPLAYILAGPAKWLAPDMDQASLDEVHRIRNETSKKAPETRRQELVEYVSQSLLDLVAKRADHLVQSTQGCQLISEALLETSAADKSAAIDAVAQLTAGAVDAEGHVASNAAASRMLKTLVLGGPFDPSLGKVRCVEPRLGFGAALYAVIAEQVVDWACSDSSFVVVAFLESEDVEDTVKSEIRGALKKARKRLEDVATGGQRGNTGAKILLEKID